MNNYQIKKDYLKKIKLIQEYNKYYFDKNKPIVPDQEYDFLKKKNHKFRKKIFIFKK